MTIECDTGNWSFETDIVIIGGGGCGLTAAIAAGQHGAEVLVLEKQERPLSNTQRSYGMIPAGGTRLQAEAGVSETPESFTQDILNKNHHQGNYETTLHIARTIVDVVHWLIDDVGAELHFVNDFAYPGHSTYRMHAPPNRSGQELYDALRVKLSKMAKVDVIKDAPVSALIADEDNQVLGVVVKRGNTVERVKAKKVILASNGFGGNEAMLRQYIPEMVHALYLGGEGNTGEGILWGMALGAETAFMDAYQAHGSVAIPYNILISYAMVSEGGIQVNLNGERFGNEQQGYSERALEVLEQTDGIAWMIYPERLHQLGLTFEEYRNAQEADAIKKAETINDLASKISIDESALRETIDSYNEWVVDGMADNPLGFEDEVTIIAPYYVVKVTGALFHTQGGLKVDHHARVMKKDGSVIANLYAGGGVAAGVSGHGAAGYLSGNGLLTALGYGYLAGNHAGISLKESELA